MRDVTVTIDSSAAMRKIVRERIEEIADHWLALRDGESMNMQDQDRWLAEARRRDETENALKIELGILKYRLELAEAALAGRVATDRAGNPEPWRGVVDVEVTPLGRAKVQPYLTGQDNPAVPAVYFEAVRVNDPHRFPNDIHGYWQAGKLIGADVDQDQLGYCSTCTGVWDTAEERDAAHKNGTHTATPRIFLP